MTLDVQTLHDHLQALANLADIPIAPDEIRIISQKAPHKPPSSLPSGKMAVYIFVYNGQCLKVGKVGSKSNARYTSQHYYPGSSNSNLAKSIMANPAKVGLCSIDAANVGEWIKNQTDRIDILFTIELGIPFLTLAESFLQYWLKPTFEGFESQKHSSS